MEEGGSAIDEGGLLEGWTPGYIRSLHAVKSGTNDMSIVHLCR